MEKSSFDLFIDLVTFDQSLNKVVKKVSDFRIEIADLTKQLSFLKVDQENTQNRVRQLRKEVDEKEHEMKNLDEQEKSTRTRLSAVVNQKEYKAFKDESHSLKKKQHDYESTLLEVWGTFENAQKECDRKQLEFTQKIEELQKLLQEKQLQVVECEGQLNSASDERAKKEQQVPKEWLEKYDRMKHSVQNPVVPVVSLSCSACFYCLSQEDLILIKQSKMTQCKGCYRLLYGPQETVVS